MTKTTPYNSQPKRAFWRRSVSALDWEDVDPVGEFGLRIARQTKVATAGSCFAQHIARHLAAAGFNYYVTEPGHPLLSKELRSKYSYGLFSARYGNIYTAAQLNQLFGRAFGDFVPNEPDWEIEGGRWIDPFRPNVQERGFSSHAELLQDREKHLSAVRELFSTSDVFVFTLGLTEAWRSREDGAVFPLCPGVKGGVFDPARYEFVNFEFNEVVDDMRRFMERVRLVNPGCRFVLTVSPVPLMATASDQHVLTATTLSKSILRAAADFLRRNVPDVHYFPSYEVITGAHTRGRYFGADLREVEERGVERVMSLFFKHAMDIAEAPTESAAKDRQSTPESSPPADAHIAVGQKMMGVLCDEELLDKAAGPA